MKTIEKLDLKVDSNTLEISYQPRSGKVLFDICDFNGQIYHSGRIVHKTTLCDIAKIPKGKYFLYIIDSGKIHKKPINF